MWLAFGLTVTIQGYGVPPFQTVLIVAPFWVWWLYMAIPSSVFMTNLGYLCVDLFFRDVAHRNTFKVPAKGPVIFVCAPHANQLLDPLVVMRTCPRRVAYLCATKTMQQRVAGFFARALDCIPVERPQDLKKAGAGACVLRGDRVVGTGTRFAADFTPRDKIELRGKEYAVAEVLGDTELRVKGGTDGQEQALEASPYCIVPRADTAPLYGILGYAMLCYAMLGEPVLHRAEGGHGAAV
jgi:glycerol-3-phosphate O-acyltransferase/dihydroxyacetone phosphate acyltransferase